MRSLLIAMLLLVSSSVAFAQRKPAPRPGARPSPKATATPTPTPAPTPTVKAKAKPTPTPPSFDCEAVKERLAGSAMRCAEQARAAAAIPCSATGHTRLLALDLACTQQRDPRGAKKAPLASEVKAGSCRALAMSGGGTIAEADVADYQACSRAIAAKVVATQCQPGVAQVEYLFLRGGQEPFATSLPCPEGTR